MPQPLEDTFEAFFDLQPPGPPSIRVTGKIEVNSGGWSAVLSKAVPQGINPNILLLNLTTTPPEGMVTKPILPIDVTPFFEKPAVHKYTEVTIAFEGASFTLSVQVVH